MGRIFGSFGDVGFERASVSQPSEQIATPRNSIFNKVNVCRGFLRVAEGRISCVVCAVFRVWLSHWSSSLKSIHKKPARLRIQGWRFAKTSRVIGRLVVDENMLDGHHVSEAWFCA